MLDVNVYSKMIAYLRRLRNEETDARFERFDDVYPVLYDRVRWYDGVPSCEGQSLADKTVFYFRAVGNEYERVNRLVRFAKRVNIHVVDSYLNDGATRRTKDIMYNVLREHDIPQPKTMAMHGLNNAIEHALRCIFHTYPCVLKFAKGGRRGIGTFLITERDDWVRVHNELRRRYNNGEKGHASRGDWPFVLQEYIPNTGDYRAMVVGGECIGVVKRGEKSMDELVMNSSEHGARKYKNNRWPRAVGNLAVEAANAMKVDIAGVDIVRHRRTGQLYVLEVNEAPAFHVFERQTGVDVAGKIVEWLRTL